MYMPEWIYIVDILFFFVVLLAVLRGVRRGFYRELAGVLAFILFMYGFYFGYPFMRGVVESIFGSLGSVLQAIVAALILFFLTVVFYVGIRLFSDQILQARLGVFTDKFSGFIMGVVRGVVLLVALMAVFSEIPGGFLYEIVTTKSLIGEFIDLRLDFLSPR
jgi:uncharacterized membrane protein required for colicin V production